MTYCELLLLSSRLNRDCSNILFCICSTACSGSLILGASSWFRMTVLRLITKSQCCTKYLTLLVEVLLDYQYSWSCGVLCVFGLLHLNPVLSVSDHTIKKSTSNLLPNL